MAIREDFDVDGPRAGTEFVPADLGAAVARLLPSVDRAVELAAALLGRAAGDASVADDLARIEKACVGLRSLVVSTPVAIAAAVPSPAESRRQLRHELRTPLNAIKGYGEMTLEDARDDDRLGLVPELVRLVAIADRLLLDIDALFSETAAPQPVDGPSRAADGAAPAAPGLPVAEGPRGRILAVDDATENLAVLERRLTRLGHQVVTTTSGHEALRLLPDSDFDLVLLDLMMPEIDGFEVLTKIKADPRTRGIPVVMISALNEIASVVRCLDAGADDYLPKPFDPTLLRARVGSCLEKKKLRDSEQAHLQRLEMQAEILARELDAARRMQQSILPVRYPLCPNSSRNKRCGLEQCSLYRNCPGIRLTASMIPAKEVGGDFYEFFWLDPHRLGFAVADVSGKGVPAALFMSLSLALLRTVAPDSNGPADCLARLNRKLCVDNDLSMFVTMFYGVYDAASGMLRYASAGHGSPLLTTVDGVVEPLPRPQGTALGVIDEVVFEERSVVIPPSATLCAYTDGVTEAVNADFEEFGEERLVRLLVESRQKSADGILAAVLGAVEKYAKGMPQADDITCLILRRASARRQDTLKVVMLNQLPEIRRLALAVEEFLGRHAIDPTLVFQVNLVLDEVLTNSITYGFPEGKVSEIEIDLFLDDNKVVARVLDFGCNFNPLERADADIVSGLDDRQIGGLGVHFARTFMSDVEYWRQGDKNCLLLVKRFETNIQE